MKLTFKLNHKLPALNSNTYEYFYNVWFNNGRNIYRLDGYFTTSAVTSKQAKEQIKTQSLFCNIIDNLIEDRITKYCNGVFPDAIFEKSLPNYN